MTKIINLFGGPGIGKSTMAAGLFYEMKQRLMSVELVQEYAKEKVWENNTEVLADQLYVTAKQYRRVSRLIGKVDYVVTDCPILLGAYYGKKYGQHADIVPDFIKKLFCKHNNICIMLGRYKPFIKAGRLGSEESALETDKYLENFLKTFCKYHEIPNCKIIVNSAQALFQELQDKNYFNGDNQ